MWHALVPVKSWDVAKSRLAVADADRRSLACAMTIDTVTAIAASPAVEHVTVVVNDHHLLGSPALDEADRVLCQPDPRWQVNRAIRWAVGDHDLGHLPVAVLLGDLPALRPTSLEPLLHQAASHRQVMAVDRHGTGTTMLAAVVGAHLTPRFGPRSAHDHRAAGVVELAGASPDLRCDVDTVDDLHVAHELGLGPATAAELARLWPSLPWPA